MVCAVYPPQAIYANRCGALTATITRSPITGFTFTGRIIATLISISTYCIITTARAFSIYFFRFIFAWTTTHNKITHHHTV